MVKALRGKRITCTTAEELDKFTGFTGLASKNGT